MINSQWIYSLLRGIVKGQYSESDYNKDMNIYFLKLHLLDPKSVFPTFHHLQKGMCICMNPFGNECFHLNIYESWICDTGELGYDGPLYDRFLHMTDYMLGPSPMHIKYLSYVYDGFCIWRTNFPGHSESVISKFTCISIFLFKFYVIKAMNRQLQLPHISS